MDDERAPVDDSQVMESITELQIFCATAHEFFTQLQLAGFDEAQAWDLLVRQLPQFPFPVGETTWFVLGDIDDGGDD